MDANAFVGRAEELSSLREALTAFRLVTIVGAPGVGKTRLARELMKSQKSAAFLDLTTSSDENAVVSALARALDIPLAAIKSAPEAVERLTAALAHRPRMLFVLDNFEHLIPVAESTLLRWLATDHVFLVTSRKRLELPSEHVFTLAPLDAAGDGVRLFVERARGVRADFTLQPGDEAFVRSLVSRLDGVPLAIELAAARVGVLGVRQIDERIAQSFELLDKGGALSGALEWSWSLLTEPERRTLRQVSAFAGGFDAEAAEAVVELDPTPLFDALDALRQRSLLVASDSIDVPGEVRFGMLETVRGFAQRKLEESQEAGVFARHAAHFVARARAWSDGIDGPDALDCLRHLGAERDNLRAVHRRALARKPLTGSDIEHAIYAITSLERFVQLREPVGAHHAMLGHAIDLATTVPETPPRALAEALRVRSGYSMFLGRGLDAIADEERALVLARNAGDRQLEARLLAGLALAGTMKQVPMLPEDATQAFSAARRGLERAIELYATRDARMGVMLNNLGVVAESLGDHAAASEAYDRALDCYQNTPCTSEGVALASRAALRFAAGDLAGAQSDFRRALDIQQRFSDRRMEVYVLGALGALLVEQGLCDQARARLEASLARQRAFGFRWFEAPALASLGDLERRLGDASGARLHYASALEVAQKSGDTPTQCRVLTSLSALASDENDLDRARADLDAAEKLANSPTLQLLVEVARGFVDLASARLAPDPNTEREATTRVRSKLERIHPLLESLRSPDARFARQMLERRLGEHLEARAGRDHASSIRITADGKWFRMPDSEGVPLHRRQALALILKSLLGRRIELPGEGIGLAALFEAGWPGERVDAHSAALRVHQAVATLRKLGLREVLVRKEDGYLLDPNQPVLRVQKPDAS